MLLEPATRAKLAKISISSWNQRSPHEELVVGGKRLNFSFEAPKSANENDDIWRRGKEEFGLLNI